jgi:3-oxoacyl-[acyl-carrier-protein] synthase II
MKALLGKRTGDRSIEDPSQASRPFSADRAGFVLAEGAGMMVLATESAVRRLNLTPQAEVVGWTLNTDGFHMAIPHGERIERCLANALKRSEVRPEDVDYYNAHGTSTTVNDRVETLAVKAVFGDHSRRLPISSIKGAIGHSLGAASAIEAAACIRAIRDGLLPPTINYLPDPELDLDYIPGEARAARVNTVMSASFGFGGTNNALIFRRWIS